jgi:hypothetical protein
MDEELNKLDIVDPVALKKYNTAVEVLKLIAEDGLPVRDACAQAGITARTYYRWVEEGIFRALIGGEVTQAVHDTQIGLIKELPTIIKVQVELATGVRKGTNFDIHNAAKFLFEKVLDPTMKSFLAEQLPPEPEEEEDPAQKFLETKKEWEDLPPGEKVVETTTRVVERQVPSANLEVAFAEEAGDVETVLEDDSPDTSSEGSEDELPETQ